MVGIISQAGSSIQFQGAGEWVADMSQEEQQAAFADDPTLKQRWDEQYGDRQTELVIIGLHLDREAIEAQLDACLLTDEEMQADWSTFTDNLPSFVVH